MKLELNQQPFISHGYIDGHWCKASSGATFKVHNPANQQVLAELPDMGKADVEQAITSAYHAQKKWQKTSPDTRYDLLMRWHNLLIENKQLMAELITAESGKPMKESLGEVAYGASFIQWFAEEGRRAYGEVIPSASDRMLLVKKQAVGVCAAITPWNFPLAMITRKVAPALAAGCCMVVKPAESTPISALFLAQLAEQAGFTKGLLNIITASSGKEVGEALCQSSTVRKLSFTGSTQVGKTLLKQCADTVKRVSMELGGNAPFIVFDDADIDLAVQGALTSKFRNAGQTCICTNRILVQRGVYNEFAEKLANAVKAMTMGDGLDPNTQIGPLINQQAIDKVDRHVQDAIKKGAHLVTGGTSSPLGDNFYIPTVLTEVTPEMSVATEETFGPVAALFAFDNEQEAIDMANATEFGLAAYFYSQNTQRCFRVNDALEYGMVGVNEGLISTAVAPFGGIKESGIGREGARQGIDEYLELKYTCFGGLE